MALVVMVMAVLSPAWSVAQDRSPRPPEKKRIPFNLLKDAADRMEAIEAIAKKGKKASARELEEAALGLREARLQIKEFLIDTESRKEMLPAYDCCPCKGGRPGEENVVTIKVETVPGTETQPTPPTPVLKPMDEARYSKLLGALNEQGFADDKLSVLSTAAKDQTFTVVQVKGILAQFSFPDDKLSALRMMKGRIVDKENVFQLYGAFVHSSDKDEAKKILEGE